MRKTCCACNALARSSLTRQAAFFSKGDNSPPSPERCDALGRRAREAVPDSRAEVSWAQARSARSPSEQGRRHLVVISQVKRQSRRERESAGGLEQTASHVAFLPHPRECAGKRKTGRFSKTLEIISLNTTSAVRTRDLRPRAKPGLRGWRASKPPRYFPVA